MSAKRDVKTYWKLFSSTFCLSAFTFGQARSMLDQAQKAEAAHYKWSSNLSNALYAGTEFTGSMDSAFTCGGGYIIIPLMRKKFVEELHWIEEQEMLDLL